MKTYLKTGIRALYKELEVGLYHGGVMDAQLLHMGLQHSYFTKVDGSSWTPRTF
jgi:hypothetical protein